jgi:hypothetical protein
MTSISPTIINQIHSKSFSFIALHAFCVTGGSCIASPGKRPLPLPSLLDAPYCPPEGLEYLLIACSYESAIQPESVSNPHPAAVSSQISRYSLITQHINVSHLYRLRLPSFDEIDRFNRMYRGELLALRRFGYFLPCQVLHGRIISDNSTTRKMSDSSDHVDRRARRMTSEQSCVLK